MQVEVTADDISRGELGDGGRCPVALALQRRLGADLFVDGFEVYKTLSGGRARLPEEARLFAKAFDAGEEVEPFEFELDDEKLYL